MANIRQVCAREACNKESVLVIGKAAKTLPKSALPGSASTRRKILAKLYQAGLRESDRLDRRRYWLIDLHGFHDRAPPTCWSPYDNFEDRISEQEMENTSMAGPAVSPIAYQQGEGETFWSFGALATVKASAETRRIVAPGIRSRDRD